MPETLRQKARHPMRLVMQRTGLSADVLRAWEKRYGVVTPDRSDGGQRLYSDDDVERLILLRRATASGRNIGQIAVLPAAELERLVEEDAKLESEVARLPSHRTLAARYFLNACLRAIEQLDAVELEGQLRTAVLQLSAPEVLDQVLVPLLREVGERWHRGEITPAHEHLGSAAIRRVLGWMAGMPPRSQGAPVVVVATPANQRHELGAALAATTASTEGWRVVFLGADLPAEAIAQAALQADASIVALSMIYPQDDPAVISEVRQIRRLLPPEIHVVVGGPAAARWNGDLTESGVLHLEHLGQFRALLRQHHAPRA